MDINVILSHLSQYRPIFHSEADFQHALAWDIHRQFPDADIRIERPYRLNDKRIHVDIVVQSDRTTYGVELKYGTSKLNRLIGGEDYDVRDQSADDLTRHGFCKDIERLERLKQNNDIDTGIAVFLTNYPPFWTGPKTSKPTNYETFRLHESRQLHGLLTWATNTSANTLKFAGGNVELSETYDLRWTDYSMIEDEKRGLFRVLVVNV